MSLFGIFGGDSTSKTTTTSNSYDQRVGAGDGGTANRIDTSGDVTIGSDAVAGAALNATTGTAIAAIQNSKDVLAQSTDFLSKELASFFNVLDKRSMAAENEVQQAHELAAQATLNAQSTDADKIIKIVVVLAVAGVAFAALKSGAIKL